MLGDSTIYLASLGMLGGGPDADYTPLTQEKGRKVLIP